MLDTHLYCCFFGQVQLSVEDIEMILDTLIFDGKVEQSIVAGGDAGQTKLYRAVNPLIPPSGLMRMPCGSCPVSTVKFLNFRTPENFAVIT